MTKHMIDPSTNQALPQYLLVAHKAKAAGIWQVRLVGVVPAQAADILPPVYLIVEASDERRFLVTLTPMLRLRIAKLAQAHKLDPTQEADLRRFALRPEKSRVGDLDFWDPLLLPPTEKDTP